MTANYLAGKRILGESDKTVTTTGSFQGWKELGRTTLSSEADDITVSGLANKRYLMVLVHCTDTGQANCNIRFNGDTGSNYGTQTNRNGSQSNYSSANFIQMNYNSTHDDKFHVFFVANKSDKPKLTISMGLERGANSGASNAPSTINAMGKWHNTSDAISSVTIHNTGSGGFTSGSEVVVLGHDPLDTHTSGHFWDQLASVELSSDGNIIDSGVFTAKKYLWFQIYKRSASGDNPNMLIRYNDDDDQDYTYRYQENYGSSTTATSQNKLAPSFVDDLEFVNAFAINTTGNEKLTWLDIVSGASAGSGASGKPDSWQEGAKWVDTSNQITRIQADSGSGNFATGSWIKVWGHD